jgi:mono/diheme cytochrome c family protein
MRPVGRLAVPLSAGLAAAVAAFAAVALTTDGGERAADGAATTTEADRPAPAPVARSAGLAVFTRMGCGGCHRLAAANSTGPIGPDLDARLPVHTRESLRAKILSPPPNTPMPANFGERMSDAELDALVDFLMSARRSR